MLALRHVGLRNGNNDRVNTSWIKSQDMRQHSDILDKGPKIALRHLEKRDRNMGVLG